MKKPSLLLFLLLLLGVNSSFAQGIRDIIAPLKVSGGKPDTTVISDLFYSPDYPVDFKKNKELNVLFEPSKQVLLVSPNKNFMGFTLLEFSFKGKKYAIPVESKTPTQSVISYTFRYNPGKKVEKVSLFGSFNKWNRDANPMTLKDSVYETTLSLEPGSYVYKFIVDGKETLDPVNPERAPTGFEDYNSVARVSDPNPVKVFLQVDKYKADIKQIYVSFQLEKNGVATPPEKNRIYALLDNQKIDAAKIKCTGNRIEITLPKKDLAGHKLLRVACVSGDHASNLQSVPLEDGKPIAGAHKKLDWEDGAIYSIMVDRFNDGDKSNSIPVVHDSLFPQANYNGGDFQGIINKIDEGYFDSLGINIIWISPVYDNPNVAYREYPAPHRWYSGYHGYWPVSATAVEEKFGTMAKLTELVDKAHKHNFRVLLDIVAHHVHIEHPYYKNHPEWFGQLNLPDGRKNLRLWDEYRLTTWFEPYMPSFDYTSSQEAIDTMSSNCIWWLKQTHADGFRHDAVKHVPNVFWRSLTKKLKTEIEIPENKRVYQIGETFGNNDLVASYVNNGQLSAQFNFDLSYLAIPIFLEPDKSFQTLDFYMSKTFASFGYNNIMGNIMDSHDKVRFMTYADGKVKAQGVDTREMAWNDPPKVDHPESYDKAKLFYAFMFTIPGLPTIYYGSEFGMTGADDPDNRRMMRFGNALSDNEKRMLEETKKIVRLRNQHSALRYGDFYTVQADNNSYSYLRSDFSERLLVVLNKAEVEKQVSISLPATISAKNAVDVLTGEKVGITDGRLTVTAPKIGYRVLRIE